MNPLRRPLSAKRLAELETYFGDDPRLEELFESHELLAAEVGRLQSVLRLSMATNATSVRLIAGSSPAAGNASEGDGSCRQVPWTLDECRQRGRDAYIHGLADGPTGLVDPEQISAWNDGFAAAQIWRGPES